MFETKVVEKIKTHIPFFLNHAIYEIMWKYNVEPGRPQMARYLRPHTWSK
jgi:hypothetical protein